MLRLYTRSRAACVGLAILAAQYVLHVRWKYYKAEMLRGAKKESLVRFSAAAYSEGFKPASPSSECFGNNVDWDDKTEPKFKMNPDLYLIPTLINGPNNQLIGFRQSIVVAILLNRTVVLPPFYEHEVRRAPLRKTVPAEYRIDIQKLREYISVVPMLKAAEACNSKINAIFATRGKSRVISGSEKLVRIHMETGLIGAHYVDGIGEAELNAIGRYFHTEEKITDETLFSEPWWPKGKSDVGWMKKILDPYKPTAPIFPDSDSALRLKDVRTAYNTSAKCALYWFPFRPFHFQKPENDILRNVEDYKAKKITDENGWKFYTDIFRHSTPPPLIGRWSQEFRREMFGELNVEYLAVHWRFDKEDFFGYLCKNERRIEFCSNVKRATNATAIAMAILKKIYEVEIAEKKLINTVYFASPPAISLLLREIKSILLNVSFVKKTLTVFSSRDVQNFILRKFSNCKMASYRQLPDTISQIEMDLCEHCLSFMWSRQSTWSRNVLTRRELSRYNLRKNDVSVTDYTLRTMSNIMSRNNGGTTL